jgi:hypothetical protein
MVIGMDGGEGRAGGGNGGLEAAYNSTAGANNSGSGGGGGVPAAGVGSAGGSGIVIIAYSSSLRDMTVGAGLTFSLSTVSRSGFKVYTFTGGTGTVSW